MYHLTIKSYEHKGIKIAVKINYDNGEVSLVENNVYDQRIWNDKHYVFAGRGLEYMKGWQNILDAMKYAITEATKELEKSLAEKSKFIELSGNKSKA